MRGRAMGSGGLIGMELRRASVVPYKRAPWAGFGGSSKFMAHRLYRIITRIRNDKTLKLCSNQPLHQGSPKMIVRGFGNFHLLPLQVAVAT